MKKLSIYVVVAVTVIFIGWFLLIEKNQQDVDSSNPNVEMHRNLGDNQDGLGDEDDESNEPNSYYDSWITSAYLKELPPEPSESDARNSFPDVNQNKVRDDIEILIVEEYGESEMMVETLFAQARNIEYDLKIASDGDVTQEEILKRNSMASQDTACRFFYYTQTLGTSNEYFEDKTYEIVEENYNNSSVRMGYYSDVLKALNGSISSGVELGHDECQAYLEESKNLDI